MSTAVLIVNYRTYDDLARCLASVEAMCSQDDEVVVVDYETNAERLTTIAQAHPRAVMIPRTDNRGFAFGVNLAANASSAPFLLLLNPDAVLEGPVAATLEAWFVAHPGTGVVGPRILNTDGSVQPSARKFPGLSTAFGGRRTWLTQRFPNNWWTRHNLGAIHSGAAIDVDWISGACFMTPREVFEHANGFDERFFLYWEDADYCRRLRTEGYRCTYVPTVSVRHAGGASARHEFELSTRAFHDSAFRLYDKYAGPLGRLVSPIVHAGLSMRSGWLLQQARRPERKERG